MARDEFSLKVKRILAQRSAYRCNNPDCRQITIGPHFNPDKSLDFGVAAHISAASKGGARYDSEQSKEERESISNGIWLCHNCSDKVDKDFERFDKQMLLKWKADHENWTKGEGWIPSLPQISITTLDGVPVSIFEARVINKDDDVFKYHVLNVVNPNNTVIEAISFRLQFPELIIFDLSQIKIIKPAGVDVNWQPEETSLIARVSGGGSVTTGASRGSMNFLFEADKLLPGQTVSVQFKSVVSKMGEIPVDVEGQDVQNFYLDGNFKYKYQKDYFDKEVFVPVKYDNNTRMVSSLTPQDSTEGFKVVKIYSMEF